MRLAQDISSLVLSLRRRVNIKVRQPLQTILVPVDGTLGEHLEKVQELILNEVNVKELRMVSGTAGLLVKRVKPDFKKLGPRYGKHMKAIAAALQNLPQEAIAELEAAGRYAFETEGQPAEVFLSDVEIISEDIPGWPVANDGRLTVALDITLTPELRSEGITRELVNRIQNLRKQVGLDITDHIRLTLQSSPETDGAVEAFRSYICGQTLADSIEVSPLTEGQLLAFDDYTLFARIEKS
jgi:isoleucyl-tRNA synthetase